jgi:hypothetical protein
VSDWKRTTDWKRVLRSDRRSTEYDTKEGDLHDETSETAGLPPGEFENRVNMFTF